MGITVGDSELVYGQRNLLLLLTPAAPSQSRLGWALLRCRLLLRLPGSSA